MWYKFYRVTKIIPFIEIRKYKTSPRNSVEHKIYSNFMIDWIKYENPSWHDVPCVSKYPFGGAEWHTDYW